MATTNTTYVLLYDGVCALCNGLVSFLMTRDRDDRFRFAALQSDLGRELVQKHGGDPDELHTVYLIEGYGTGNERAMVRGRAALTAVGAVGGIWRIANVIAWLPRLVLDTGYRLLAKARYRMFGRYDSCPIPPADHRHKFIG